MRNAIDKNFNPDLAQLFASERKIMRNKYIHEKNTFFAAYDADGLSSILYLLIGSQIMILKNLSLNLYLARDI